MELVHAEVDPDRLHSFPRAYDRAEALVANGMRLDHTLAVGARLRSKPLVRLYEITRTLNKDKLSVILESDSLTILSRFSSKMSPYWRMAIICWHCSMRKLVPLWTSLLAQSY